MHFTAQTLMVCIFYTRTQSDTMVPAFPPRELDGSVNMVRE